MRIILFLCGVGLMLAAQTPDQSLASRTAQFDEWRSRIRSTMFVDYPLPPLDAKSHGSFQPIEGVTAERVSYGTQFGLRVPAILYMPVRRSGKIPALVVVNGHGGDKYSWYSFYSGMLYARAGAAVLTFDPAGEGERNLNRQSGTRAHDLEWKGRLRPGQRLPPDALSRRLAGLMMTDVIQAVSYLSNRPEIDPKRIGAMGYSLGSFVLDLVCAVDQRLRACVLAGGGNLDGPDGFWDRSKPLCTGTPYRALSFLGDRPAAIYALHAERGPTLIFNGLKDDVVGVTTQEPGFYEDLRKRAEKMGGRGRTYFESGTVPDGSHRPYFVTRPVALWLERNLDFPNWTGTSIAELPETHISAWARQNGVELEPFYATEEREGGIRALGAGFPGLARKTLNVLAEPEWDRQKDHFVFEAWLRLANQGTGGGR